MAEHPVATTCTTSDAPPYCILNANPVPNTPPGSARWSIETRHAARVTYRGGHPNNAIAKRCDISLGTVKSWKCRAENFEPVWKRESQRERLALQTLRSPIPWHYAKDSGRQVQLVAAALDTDFSEASQRSLDAHAIDGAQTPPER
ncbi:MAG: hypothetical protein ACR2RV_02115 [Verrucomicrobiales bacterium]